MLYEMSLSISDKHKLVTESQDVK